MLRVVIFTDGDMETLPEVAGRNKDLNFYLHHPFGFWLVLAIGYALLLAAVCHWLCAAGNQKPRNSARCSRSTKVASQDKGQGGKRHLAVGGGEGNYLAQRGRQSWDSEWSYGKLPTNRELEVLLKQEIKLNWTPVKPRVIRNLALPGDGLTCLFFFKSLL